MKIAASPNNVTSVMIALPFLKKRPPTAGRSARTRGKDCQCELSSWSWKSSSSFARGRRMSSVDERNDFRVSEKVSERNELLRRFGIGLPSAKVDALLKGRCRRPIGEGLVCRPDEVGGGSVIEAGFSEAISGQMGEKVESSSQVWQIRIPGSFYHRNIVWFFKKRRKKHKLMTERMTGEA